MSAGVGERESRLVPLFRRWGGSETMFRRSSRESVNYLEGERVVCFYLNYSERVGGEITLRRRGKKKKSILGFLVYSIILFSFLFPLSFLLDRKSTRLNSSHSGESRMPSSA